LEEETRNQGYNDQFQFHQESNMMDIHAEAPETYGTNPDIIKFEDIQNQQFQSTNNTMRHDQNTLPPLTTTPTIPLLPPPQIEELELSDSEK
jgi:hypothetical protein